ncbi:hypothetical protein SDC9_202079 [bioreactor metagenome]|uniref:Pyridoxamine 5'-phosphate oxidase-like domain-containing protein n=2 Tax=root TaxID=1 RepID=A0A645IVG0_9ZZZZ
METTDNLALATSVNNIPNVRVVNFYYDTENQGIVYLASFRGNTKTLEFLQNNNVAFTTIPTENSEQIRVTNGRVQKSDLTIYDLKEAFIKKLPNYEVVIAQAGDMLDVYEIHFKEASVTLDIDKHGKITF